MLEGATRFWKPGWRGHTSMDYKYISADNHIDTRWLPKGLWQERIGAKFKDQAPKVVETPSGSQWEWEGRLQGDSADGSSNATLRDQIFGCKGLSTPEGSLPPTEAK